MNTIVKETVELDAVTILNDSIHDIDRGLWICGALWSWSTDHEDKMGCAIGLVGINSGQFKTIMIGDEKKGYAMEYAYEAFTKDAPWPEEANKAVWALAKAAEQDNFVVPDVFVNDKETVGLCQGVVVEHNDGSCDTPATAKKWFENAVTVVMQQTRVL